MAENIKDMNMTIVVDDGSRRVPIQNKDGDEIGAFTFHPTDLGIIKRYNDLTDRAGDIFEPLTEVSAEMDGEEVDISDPRYVQALDEAGKRLYAAVNTLFGSDEAAPAFFGKMDPFSPVGGAFYCAQVLDAVGAFIGAQFEQETARFSENAKKYANRATRRARNK